MRCTYDQQPLDNAEALRILKRDGYRQGWDIAEIKAMFKIAHQDDMDGENSREGLAEINDHIEMFVGDAE